MGVDGFSMVERFDYNCSPNELREVLRFAQDDKFCRLPARDTTG